MAGQGEEKTAALLARLGNAYGLGGLKKDQENHDSMSSPLER